MNITMIIKKYKFYIIIISVTIIAVLINIYRINTLSPIAEEAKEAVIKRINNLSGELMGREINSLKDVVTDLKKIDIVMLYSGNDCSNCAEKGFKIIKKINSIKTSIKTAIVGINTNISNDIIQNDYKDYIYNDSSQLIRKELKYCITPALFIIDEKFKIIKAYFPTIYSSKEEDEEFINYAKNNM